MTRRVINIIAIITRLSLLTSMFVTLNAKLTTDDIFCAARHGSTNNLTSILKLKPLDLGKRDTHENTPLHITTENGHTNATKYLVKEAQRTYKEKAREFISTPNRDGNTPLHMVALTGNFYDLVELLNAGANINARNNYGETPLHIAARAGNKAIIQILLSFAKQSLDEKSFRAFVNSKDGDDCTALHGAARHNEASISRQLLKYGANINCKCSRGNTPLHVAALYGSVKVIEMLIKAARKQGILTNKNHDFLNQKNADGNTAVHLAAGRHDDAGRMIVCILRRFGAVHYRKNDKGQYPELTENDDKLYEVYLADIQQRKNHPKKKFEEESTDNESSSRTTTLTLPPIEQNNKH